MIVVDSNIPMYLVGGAHPHQAESQVILERLIAASVDEVIPIGKAEVLRAGEIVRTRVLMPARDAVHIAVMERHDIRSILSFDGDFDRWPGLERIHRI